MTPLVPLMMFGWPVVAVVIFAILPARRAMLWSIVLGWLFLPEATYSFPGLPDYSKAYSVSLSALLCVVIFDSGKLLAFRPSWLDLPMAGFLIAPFISSLTNNLGAYDGLSSLNGQVLHWGVPYFLGRVYFKNNAILLRELAMVMIVAALIYAPFCLWEMRMSPHLHKTFYGVHAHVFSQTKRFGGFRPTVFLQHGLMVGFWMCMTALLATWLWLSGTVKQLYGLPMWAFAAGMLLVAVMCKSIGAIMLLVVGLGILLIVKRVPVRWLLMAVLAVPVLYTATRANGTLSAELAARPAEILVPFQSGSLRWRLMHEDALIEHALTRPGFGWGGHGRSHLTNRRGARISTTDGLWIIMLGKNGLYGLGAFLLVMLLPPLMVIRHLPARTWTMPTVAPVIALAVLYTLWGVDNLFNAMISPMYVIVGGALASAAIQLAQAPRSQRHLPRASAGRQPTQPRRVATAQRGAARPQAGARTHQPHTDS